jgi:iron complex transport system substrate-binding protein
MLRTLAICLTAFALVGIAGGCGEDDQGTPAAGAVTIQNRLGDARVEGIPERVVALDFPSADDAIALGVVPVAMPRISYAEGGVQPWSRKALAGREPEELLDIDAGIPIEKVAALRPDLILATNTYEMSRYYDKLSRIAPVVAQIEGEGVDSWQTAAVRIGRALGRERRARRLVTRVEDRVAAAARANPNFEGSTISFFNVVGDVPWVINSTDDFSIRFLSALGFRLPAAVAKLQGADGRAEISLERLDLLEADVILATSLGCPNS